MCPAMSIISLFCFFLQLVLTNRPINATKPGDRESTKNTSRHLAQKQFLDVPINSYYITTVAGADNQNRYNGDGGNALAATFSKPETVWLNANKEIYVTDVTQNVLRKINLNGIISTIAGIASGGYAYGDGGPATSAVFAFLTGVAGDTAGNLYLADSNAPTIRKLQESTGIITLFAGTQGTAAYGGDGGAATSASINFGL